MGSINEEDREELISYLDGEADEKTSHAIEARINVDGAFRAEADALKQAWEMLDYLPRPEPSSSFTHRTLERVAIREGIVTMTMPGRPWKSWALGIGWAAGILLAVTGGFILASWIATESAKPDPPKIENVLVQDLKVIQYQHLYENIPDLEFLQKLDRPEFFGGDGQFHRGGN